MDIYQGALLAAVMFVTWLAWDWPRALQWLVLLTLSFIASTLWWDSGFSYPAMFAGLADTFTVLIMQRLAQQKWEMRLANAVHLMIFINFTWQTPGAFHYLFGDIAVHFGVSEKFLYGALLDVGNWLALLVIGGTAAVQMAGNHGISAWGFARSLLDPIRAYLLAPRKGTSYWSRP